MGLRRFCNFYVEDIIIFGHQFCKERKAIFVEGLVFRAHFVFYRYCELAIDEEQLAIAILNEGLEMT